jgi:hypothetical protein
VVRNRAFRATLGQRAQKAGIFAKEAKVRQLLNDGKTSAASALRAEVMNEMRRLAIVLSHELSLASSL